MRIEGTTLVRAPREQVYAAFTDPECLRKATPGVQEMTPAGEDRFDAVMKLGVAGITGTFTGSLVLLAKQAPAHYELSIAGQGSTGFVQGKGAFDFTEVAGATEVRYDWDVQVGGTIAGVGQRALTGVGKLLIGQFMKAMEKQVVG